MRTNTIPSTIPADCIDSAGVDIVKLIERIEASAEATRAAWLVGVRVGNLGAALASVGSQAAVDIRNGALARHESVCTTARMWVLPAA